MKTLPISPRCRLSQRDPKFKELEDHWYKKLRDEGFEDIEDTSHSDRPLRVWHSLCFYYRATDIQRDTRKAYYTQAERLLQSFEFESPLHKEIWRLHCQGLTEREIADNVKIYKKSMVHYVISKIATRIKRE